MNCEIVVAVVIYNSLSKNSPTCSRLEKIQKNTPLHVIVADNSTIDSIKKSNAGHVAEQTWTYLDMHGNVGLSVAYNRIIEHVGLLEKNRIIVWCDDDTEITEEYFKALENAANENERASIFTPIIYGTDGIIYSPNNRGFFKNKLLKSANESPVQSRFNAINSCMAIRTDLFRTYRYDEKLFMDSVDQKFCEDMCSKGVRFQKLDTEVTQNFFQRGNDINIEKAWIRYQIRIKDFMNYANKSIISRWASIIKVSAWGVQMGIKCKSITFMIKCIFSGVKSAFKLSCGKDL